MMLLVDVVLTMINLQDLSAVVEDYSAPCIDTVTSTIANSITKKWALKKFGATIQLLLVKKCKKFELFSV